MNLPSPSPRISVKPLVESSSVCRVGQHQPVQIGARSGRELQRRRATTEGRAGESAKAEGRANDPPARTRPSHRPAASPAPPGLPAGPVGSRIAVHGPSGGGGGGGQANVATTRDGGTCLGGPRSGGTSICRSLSGRPHPASERAHSRTSKTSPRTASAWLVRTAACKLCQHGSTSRLPLAS